MRREVVLRGAVIDLGAEAQQVPEAADVLLRAPAGRIWFRVLLAKVMSKLGRRTATTPVPSPKACRLFWDLAVPGATGMGAIGPSEHASPGGF